VTGPGTATAAAGAAVRRPLVDYFAELPRLIARCAPGAAAVLDAARFNPGYALPPLDAPLRAFLGAGVARWRRLADYRDRRVFLLDLMGNPATNTTKTFGSLLIVARLVEFIRRTGEPVAILTPTSGNKGVALRDAVLRAIRGGLVDPDRLRIILLVPAASAYKLRASSLGAEPHQRARNPVLVHHGPAHETVKALAGRFVREHARDFRAVHGEFLFPSHDLANYAVADALRAFVELDAGPPRPGVRRLHAQAVSSAFGLLGYSRGRDVLEAGGGADPAHRPGLLLVQHLGTPDLVACLRYGGTAAAARPTYQRDPGAHSYRQGADPHFPAVAADPDETLDPTFYTRQPATAAEVVSLVHRYGGDGIVVSRYECEQRYPWLRDWVAGSGVDLPPDPATLREWSLPMVLTGVVNAVDRGLAGDVREIVVHGTGCYSTADYAPLPAAAQVTITGYEDLPRILLTG
jgi:hypothetical protein